jgi:enamine deaminase RidA (YjgF/YER057c/UK114 family)
MNAIRINPNNVWADSEFPFNQAVVESDGKCVHLTGQVAWDRNGKVIGRDDAKKQTECAIDNIVKILAELGGMLDDIVSMTMYYVRDQDLSDIQSERIRRFKKPTGPAVTGVKVAALVDPELLVELTAIAVIPDERFQNK